MKNLLLIVLTLFSYYTYGQAGQWTWMHGDSVPNPIPFYGTQELTDSLNNPPGRYEAADWTDLQGNFWMFGGSGTSGRYNDLWKFNPLINQWTWMKGSDSVNQKGVYGFKGVSGPENVPGARGFGVATWVDMSGNLWLFGGNGYDSAGVVGELNDLWTYNILTNQWTWIKGSPFSNQAGYYGVKLVPSSSNDPKGRHETSATWVDNNNNLWLFGGTGNLNSMNDLWRYNITTNQWTWMNGDSTLSKPGIYGTINVSGSENSPGSRWVFAKWQSEADYFYLFGGVGYDAFGNHGKLNDLWLYSAAINQWTWISGNNTVEQEGSVNSMCVSSETNLPSARMENRATWKDTCNNFIMFGGYNEHGYYNDLWSYNIKHDKWTWIGGDNIPNQQGEYGIKLISSLYNKPCGRWGSVGWKDRSGNLWMFGGSRNGNLNYNDMWKFKPDPECAPCYNVSVDEHRTNNQINVYPDPVNQNAILQFDNSTSENCRLTLYDSQGRFVRTISDITTNQVEIERNELSLGLYFFQLSTERKIIANGKFVVE